MGVLWGEVSVEVLSRFLGYVLFVLGSRSVGRGGDDGWVPCEKGGGRVNPSCLLVILTSL